MEDLLKLEQEIRNKTKETVTEFTDRTVEDISLDDQFIKDLGYDSLDGVEFLMSIEDEYDIKLDDDFVEKCLTVKQMSDYIVKEVMNQKHGTEL